jgi:hypothetical protein
LSSPKPKHLDAAYEEVAMRKGLIKDPVFHKQEWGQPAPIRNAHPDIPLLVKHDIMSRMQFGKSKYGTALQPHNGRDALKDAYEEALDLCQYLRQALYERDGK